MQKLQSDWQSYPTPLAISVQWLEVVIETVALSSFPEVLGEDFEILLDYLFLKSVTAAVTQLLKLEVVGKRISAYTAVI